MAEIRVERKQGAGKWLWILLLVIVLIAVAAYLWYAGYINLGAAEGVTTEEAWRMIRNV
jgi:drug/metabolite transporter (DMT)-like permease